MSSRALRRTAVQASEWLRLPMPEETKLAKSTGIAIPPPSERDRD
jgi:hypothetical protein